MIPTVDDVDRAREAVKWARYPPVARRSAGAGQAASIWGINGINYRQTFNDNMLVVIMIATPTGAANAYDIASVPGVDVVIIGNTQECASPETSCPSPWMSRTTSTFGALPSTLRATA